MQELIILSHTEYAALRQSLKERDMDLCYSASSARPLRTRWAPERVHDEAFRQAIEARRPAGDSFHIASVKVIKPGNCLWPDQLAVTFHAVSEAQEAALHTYLTAHRIGMADPKTTEPAHDAEDHASSATYIQIALILAVLTALEVAAFYLPDGMQPPGWMLLVVLVLLSIVKFGLVASYFMHLRYDHRIYASCFAAGLVVATGTILALVALFRDPTNLMVATADAQPQIPRAAVSHGKAPHAPPPLQVAANPADAGSGVFEKYGCGACHIVTSLPTARGNIGPALDGLAERAAKRVPNMSSGDYIRQSIEAPGAYVVKGYLKLMPNLRTAMSDQEYDALIAWLEAL